MSLYYSSENQNLILQMMSQSDLDLLAPHLEAVTLTLRQPLEVAHEAIPFVYFPHAGLGSVVAKAEGNLETEVALFGREGMSATALIMGDDQSPFDCFIQMEGAATRLSSSAFLSAMSTSASLRPFLMRYAHASAIQSSFTALANSQAKLQARLARWLLMVHDRVTGDSFSLTHEFLAVMLGVRRSGVTEALHMLEGLGTIKSLRSEVIVKDRDALIALAGSTYGPAEKEYHRLMGRPFEGATGGLPQVSAL